MKIKSSNLKKLIEQYILEQEGPGDFDLDTQLRIDRRPSDQSLYGLAVFFKSILKGESNYLLTAPNRLYSIAGGVSDKGSINTIPEYMKDFLYIMCLVAIKMHKDKGIDFDSRNQIVITSIYRSPHFQLVALKDKLKAGETPEEIAQLYSPDSDFTMTDESYNSVLKTLEHLQNDDDHAALHQLTKVPISPHDKLQAIDFRSDGSRGNVVMNAIAYMIEKDLVDPNILFHNKERDHIHVAALSDPITKKGKSISRYRTRPGDLKSLLYYDKVVNKK